MQRLPRDTRWSDGHVCRRSLAVLLTLALAACAPRLPPVPAAMRQPNVLFIAVDDLRPTLGAYGDRTVKTPNIDRLARSGAVFLQTYAQVAVCNPSRASLLTGLRPDSLRVWDLATDFRDTLPNVVTLPQYFRQHGYLSVSVGKIYHNTIPDPLSWSEPEYKVPGFPYDPDAVYHGHENVTIQEVRKAALIRAGRQASAIDRFGQWYLKANATENEDLPDSAYYDGAQTDYAVRRLATLRDAGKPFFFAIGYYRPHLPFNAPKRYWDMYRRESLPLAPNPFVPAGSPGMAVSTNRELRGYADFADAKDPTDGHLSDADIRRLTHGYYASISYMDAQVGRLLDQLDALGLASNTIVVLWGDNGFKLGDHNGWAKMTNYNIDTHVPLIIRAPGQITPGLRLSQMAELIDVYPTLTALAGLPVPAHLQGSSAVPLFADPGRPWKRAIFSQFLRNGIWIAHDSIPYMGYSMLTSDYHYVAWMNWNTRRYVAWELYDRRADPLENTNLVGRTEHAPLLARLEAERVAGWRQAVPGR